MTNRILVLLLIALTFLECSANIRYATPSDSSRFSRGKFREGQVLTGEASYYGPKFHGRKTASGETFDMYAMSAAHRSLPFGTVIKVVNLDNHKSVVVKVNDRGPFKKNRILDLSYAAAKELDMIKTGTANVKIIILKMGNSGN